LPHELSVFSWREFVRLKTRRSDTGIGMGSGRA
jgi:hypothetical protein